MTGDAAHGSKYDIRLMEATHWVDEMMEYEDFLVLPNCRAVDSGTAWCWLLDRVDQDISGDNGHSSSRKNSWKLHTFLTHHPCLAWNSLNF